MENKNKTTCQNLLNPIPAAKAFPSHNINHIPIIKYIIQNNSRMELRKKRWPPSANFETVRQFMQFSVIV